MRKPSEMYVASRMQNMMQIRAWNTCFSNCCNSCGALGVESPHGGAKPRYDACERPQTKLVDDSDGGA